MANVPVITVMPDAGFDGNGGSWFTNWIDSTTPLGPSKWETFHIDDVLPWVDANLRTVRSRNGRAIAGLSQGGYGAMTYATRHPDLFSSVASFSGAPEIARDPDVSAGAAAVVGATEVGLNGTQPDVIFGNAVRNRINWVAHDPAEVIPNLTSTWIHLWTATGLNGPYDPQPNPGGTGIEALTHASTQHFHDHLVEAGIPSDYNDYTYGTHTWPYWTRDLQQYVPRMMRDFAHPKTPRKVTYASYDRSWSQWGWSVAMQRTPDQDLSALAGADANGFVGIFGQPNAVATVTTRAFYRPGVVKRVIFHDRQAGDTVKSVRVSPDGRLRIAVPVRFTQPAVVTIR
jgi:S-formylglutathione hydrolase FrmB